MTSLPRPGAVIFAKDLKRMARFYEVVAGLTVVHTASDHVVLMCQGLELVVHTIPEAVASAIDVTEPPELRDEAAIKLSLPVPSLAAARSRAARLGGAVGPQESEWDGGGYRACDGYDPEGNVVQFREPLLRPPRD
jgi:catechol 2,3-dioxygenase-like lactoylglutathione lyase family enzyme